MRFLIKTVGNVSICGGGEMHAYKMFTFFFHSSSKAFVKSAETALVPFVFINNTLTIKPAQKKKNFVNILQTPC